MNVKGIALQAATDAGEKLLSLFNTDIERHRKGKNDIVTEADLVAEKIILDIIKKNFPSHNIISEEAGTEENNSDYTWVIDPLDGTINYTQGIEEYSVSIALEHNNEIIIGVIYRPESNEIFFAEKGKGAYKNNKKISVSTESHLEDMMISTDSSSQEPARSHIFQTLNYIRDNFRHVRIFGSSSLHLCRIASGQLDFYYKHQYSHWDFAAGKLIVEEAGGKVTDLLGNPITKNSQNILASNGIRHKDILEMINKKI